MEIMEMFQEHFIRTLLAQQQKMKVKTWTRTNKTLFPSPLNNGEDDDGDCGSGGGGDDDFMLT